MNPQIRSDQSLSHVRLFATPWIAACQASLSITDSWSSLRLTSIESVMPSSHLILCRPLLFLPPIPPSIRVFSNESTLHMRWPKYRSFSFSTIPSKEIPGLISHRLSLNTKCQGLVNIWKLSRMCLRAIVFPLWELIQFTSVAQSCPTLCDTMNRSTPGLPPSPAPGVHSDSHPSSQWCHPAISSSVVPFSSCPQSLPASESFPVSQLFAWGGQSTGVSALLFMGFSRQEYWFAIPFSSGPHSVRSLHHGPPVLGCPTGMA